MNDILGNYKKKEVKSTGNIDYDTEETKEKYSPKEEFTGDIDYDTEETKEKVKSKEEFTGDIDYDTEETKEKVKSKEVKSTGNIDYDTELGGKGPTPEVLEINKPRRRFLKVM